MSHSRLHPPAPSGPPAGPDLVSPDYVAGVGWLPVIVEHELNYLTRPDGVTIAYAVAGAGEPLVLIPGWTTHLGYFFRDPSSLLVGPLHELIWRG